MEQPLSINIDNSLRITRQLGITSFPTVIILAPSSEVSENSRVLFALEGERANTEVLVNAIAAALPSSSLKTLNTPQFLSSFTPKPLFNAPSIATSSSSSPLVVKEIKFPTRLTVNPISGLLYVADTGNNRILEMDVEGKVLRCFGSKAGKAGPSVSGCRIEEAMFNRPMGLAIDAAENILYVADYGNDVLRRVNLKDGTIIEVTVAPVDTDSSGERYDFPELGEIEREMGKRLKNLGSLTAEEVQRVLVKRKLTENPLARQVIGRTRRLLGPVDVVKSDAFLYVSASLSRQIWRVEGAGFSMRPVLGSGLAGQRDLLDVKSVNGFLSDEVRFIQPAGLVNLGSKLLVVDSDANSVRLVDLVSEKTATVLGGEKNSMSAEDDVVPLNGFGDIDAPGYKGKLQFPSAACPFLGDSVLVADTFNNKIKRVTITDNELFGQRVDVGTLGIQSGLLKAPQGVALSADRRSIFVSDTGNNRLLRFPVNGADSTYEEIKVNFSKLQ